MVEALRIEKLYRFKVKVPTPNHGGAGFVWAHGQSFSDNEESAVREVMWRFPDGIQIVPASFNGQMPDIKPRIICGEMDKKDRSWCQKCGQDAQYHPVVEGSHQAEDAKKWVKMWENQMYGFGGMDGMGYD